MDSPNGLTVERSVCDGRHTLTLRGTLDLASAPQLSAIVAELCAGETTGIAVDLRGLTMIDSTGLHAVLAIDNLCVREGYDLELFRGPEQVHRLFELTRVADGLPFQPSD
jgi:anti-anti-sigma factor